MKEAGGNLKQLNMKQIKNSDNPAFPIQTGTVLFTGLTKREYFAAAAMQGLLANPILHKETNLSNNVVAVSIQLADDMLRGLDK